MQNIDSTYKESFERLQGLEGTARDYQHEIKMLKKDVAAKKQVVGNYQKLLDSQPVFKCHVCVNKV